MNKTKALDQIREHDIVYELIKIIKDKQNYRDGIKGAIALLDNLLNKEPTRDNVVSKANN